MTVHSHVMFRPEGGYEHVLSRRHKEFRSYMNNGQWNVIRGGDHRSVNKYVPHQGKQEMARRRPQHVFK